MLKICVRLKKTICIQITWVKMSSIIHLLCEFFRYSSKLETCTRNEESWYGEPSSEYTEIKKLVGNIFQNVHDILHTCDSEYGTTNEHIIIHITDKLYEFSRILTYILDEFGSNFLSDPLILQTLLSCHNNAPSNIFAFLIHQKILQDFQILPHFGPYRSQSLLCANLNAHGLGWYMPSCQECSLSKHRHSPLSV